MAESIKGKRVKDWTDEQLAEHFGRLVREAEEHEDSGSQYEFPKRGIMIAIEREMLQRMFDRNPSQFLDAEGRIPVWMRNLGVTA